MKSSSTFFSIMESKNKFAYFESKYECNGKIIKAKTTGPNGRYIEPKVCAECNKPIFYEMDLLFPEFYHDRIDGRVLA